MTRKQTQLLMAYIFSMRLCYTVTAVNPLHTSLPAPMYIYAHCLFRMLFLSIISTAYKKFAIRLSGREVAIKLID